MSLPSALGLQVPRYIFHMYIYIFHINSRVQPRFLWLHLIG